mmetsp:Transcript_142005/g.453977  ORF Transcript_142005/g.453977 Transcript_142005/m.453977 type:complete len:202 (+) Transcript_142005:97-702(+)
MQPAAKPKKLRVTCTQNCRQNQEPMPPIKTAVLNRRLVKHRSSASIVRSHTSAPYPCLHLCRAVRGHGQRWTQPAPPLSHGVSHGRVLQCRPRCRPTSETNCHPSQHRSPPSPAATIGRCLGGGNSKPSMIGLFPAPPPPLRSRLRQHKTSPAFLHQLVPHCAISSTRRRCALTVWHRRRASSLLGCPATLLLAPPLHGPR